VYLVYFYVLKWNHFKYAFFKFFFYILSLFKVHHRTAVFVSTVYATSLYCKSTGFTSLF